MKTIAISTIALFVAVSSFGKVRPKNPSAVFNNYLSKTIYTHSSFALEGVSGTVMVKVRVSSNGIESASIVSGVNEKINNQILDLIKNTPANIAASVVTEGETVFIVPVKLIISE